MSKRRLRSTGYARRIRMWKLLIGAVAATLVLGVGGAGAGHETGGVKSYTGCLSGGTIYSVREGESPMLSCVISPTIHLSGGDITAVRAGPGLTGGSENGIATIGLGAGFGLPQGCANGAVPKWNGTAWACGVDNDTTPAELLSGLETFEVSTDTISLDTFEVKTVQADCPSGSIVTGGGFNADPTHTELRRSRRSASGNGWRVTAQGGLFGGVVQAFATCLGTR